MSGRKRETDPESVEQQLRRLESIVGQLAGDGIELDAALRLFEEGVGRLRAVTERLSQAEAQVKLLVEASEGEFSLEDLDE
ncbi:MAG TPA: exodeoxyribonuclease VII small subunit [Gemmatimonadaceae bacterium]|nr:exodeoxyribonuclease VII small subunit [Gemmatimonadaceae bacterium]